MTTQQQPDEPAIAEETTRRRRLPEGPRRAAAAAAALIAAVVLGVWLYQRFTHVSTDDARIASDMIEVSSKVSGWLETFDATQGQHLDKGDIVAVIDHREAKLKLDELKSNLAAVDATYRRNQAELAMVKRQTGSLVDVAKSQLSAAKAGLEAARSDLVFRGNQWQRAQSLREGKTISEQDWENARALYQKSQQAFVQSKAEVASATAKVIEAEADRDRLAVLRQELIRTGHQRDSLASEVGRQQLDLDDHRVVAPQRGIIDKTFVNAGEFVSPGQRLLLMHDPNDIWVDANIKETKIRHVHLGQSATITVDAWPDETFAGKVIRIGDSATSEFALLPSANPSGNFTKVTQRLPIRIAVEQRDGKLKPGMMVEVAIDVRSD